jgi:hypothetical protein
VRRRLRMLTRRIAYGAGSGLPVLGITELEVALTLALALNDQQSCLHYRGPQQGVSWTNSRASQRTDCAGPG